MSWRDKRVVIIGAARQGIALSRFLVGRGAQVVLSDNRPEEDLREAQRDLDGLPVEWALGGHPVSLLGGADLLCLSGGVPPTIPLVVEAQKRGIPLSNDSQIFIEETPCKVIGITGSAGKTTTTTLTGLMGQVAKEGSPYRKTFVGGNIGAPMIAFIDEMTSDDLAVMELSSFQLELMSRSPHVAAVLNIAPNHLDRHGTMEAYTAAKLNILTCQSSEDVAVLWRDDVDSWALAESVHGRLYSYGRTRLPNGERGSFLEDGSIWLRTGEGQVEVMPLEDIKLRGEHNLLNVAAACVVAAAVGLPAEAIRAGVEGFTGVPHRLELVRSWRGADWFNDSKATAPQMAVTAIKAFDEPLVVLAGGRDKNLPWDEFAQVVAERVDHLILFGEAVEVIRAALDNEAADYTLGVCRNLEQSVHTAAGIVSPGDVVLLAPGGTSFDEFKDFEERGQRFKDLVNAL
jgi:UDP-N-acetylmuramoylalanine--D-glutamate ligase